MIAGRTINTDMAAFVARVERLGPEGQRAAMRAEFAAQGGDIDLSPDTTDGFHIALFGLQTCGISESDAVTRWICTARTVLGGFPAPSDDPALRVAQIVWAMHILAAYATTPARHLRAACQIIRRLSSNPVLLARAQDIARIHDFPLTHPATTPAMTQGRI